MSPFRRYFRGALHRRLFVWFGAAIGLTAAIAMLAFGLLGSPGASTYQAARYFLAEQFAGVWNEAGRRDAMAAAIARDFDVRIELRDPEGNPLSSFGGQCTRGAMTTPIARNGAVVGQVRLCNNGHRFRSVFAPFAIAVVVLWAVSGAVARRLLRPLGELARVAADIGRGHLKSRVRIGRREGMEFSVVGNVMNEMASRIEKQLADQRALLATVSHEIRTPLSRMRLLIEFARGKMGRVELAASEVARADGPSGSGLAELEQLEREIAEIDALVADLLASSRIDFSAVTKSRLDAAAIARTVLERAGIDPGRLALPRDATWFEGDATLVTRAVQNLVDNAQHHGGGLDALRVEVSPGFVAFVVEDRGSGLLPGEETRIFEPFYRRALPELDAAGLGLGLALVKKIAEAHGGRVFAANRKDGAGARVAVAFAH